MKHHVITKVVEDTEGNEDPIEMTIHRWVQGNQEAALKVSVTVSAPKGSDFSIATMGFPPLIKRIFSPTQISLPVPSDQPTASKKASGKKAPAQVPVDEFCDTGVLLALQKVGILYIDQVCEMDQKVIGKRTGLTPAAVSELYDKCWQAHTGHKPGAASKKGAKTKKEPAKAKVA